MDGTTDAKDVLWRGRYLVLAGLAAGIGCAMLATLAASKVYEASAIVQVQAGTPAAGDAFGTQEASQALATTDATLIGSRSFLARIRHAVDGGQYTVADLDANVGARAITDNTQNTNLIDVTAKGPSPTAALLLADGVARAFVSTIGSDAAARAAADEKRLDRQIAALAHRGGSAASLAAARAALTARLGTVLAGGTAQYGSAAVVGPAVVAPGAVSPRPALNLLVGALLGLVLGIGLAWLRSALDRQLHSADEVRELVDIPVLASVPILDGGRNEHRDAREAFDVLRTNLMFVSPERPPAVIAVASARQGEGKTAVAEGLARAAAERGMRVLLVDGDLRTSSLSLRLAGSRSEGLSTLLAGGESRLRAAPAGPITELAPRLHLLPAGPTPGNPPTLLAGPEAHALLAEARASYDLIVLDTPPLAHLTDAAILASLSDASLVVVRANRTTTGDVQHAVEALGRTPAPVVGVVFLEQRSRYLARYPDGRSSWWRNTGTEPLDGENARARRGRPAAQTTGNGERRS